MESKWRQNVADLGWADSGILMIARILIGGVPTNFAAVKLEHDQKWWLYGLLFLGDVMSFLPLDGPTTFAGTAVWGPKEPD